MRPERPERIARVSTGTHRLWVGLARWALYLLGVVTWSVAIARAWVVISTVSSSRRDLWLLDWHVYAAAAHDLSERTLYGVPLKYPGWPLPVNDFNLPPAAAMWPLPLVVLPDEWGGVVWMAVSFAAWMLAWSILFSKLLELPHAWILIGLGLAAYSTSFAFDIHVSVGNINDLVLGLVAIFAWLHFRERTRAAGIALGLAIATKLWPIAIVALLIREHRWTELIWAAGTTSVTTGALLLWVGSDAITPMIDALRTTVAVEPNNPVLWVTWLRQSFSWWPAWAPIAIAVLLLLVPARGRAGLGTTVMAGLTLVPNLWGHYLPTIVFGLALASIPLWARGLRSSRYVSDRSLDAGKAPGASPPARA